MGIIDKIMCLLKANNKNQKDLTNYLGISEGTISEWKKGKTTSYIKHLDKIAEFFNIPVSYFYDEKNNYVIELSDKQQQLLNLFDQLSEENQTKIIERAETLLEMQK